MNQYITINHIKVNSINESQQHHSLSNEFSCLNPASGDLYDDGAESSNGTASSLAIYLRPVVARRLSSKLRSRMCASVGADLDQLLQDEDRRGTVSFFYVQWQGKVCKPFGIAGFSE